MWASCARLTPPETWTLNDKMFLLSVLSSGGSPCVAKVNVALSQWNPNLSSTVPGTASSQLLKSSLSMLWDGHCWRPLYAQIPHRPGCSSTFTFPVVRFFHIVLSAHLLRDSAQQRGSLGWKFFSFWFFFLKSLKRNLKINVHWCINILHCCFQVLYVLVVGKQRQLVAMAAMVTCWLTVVVVVSLEMSPPKR